MISVYLVELNAPLNEKLLECGLLERTQKPKLKLMTKFFPSRKTNVHS